MTLGYLHVNSLHWHFPTGEVISLTTPILATIADGKGQ
jgi:hypothetical protein